MSGNIPPQWVVQANGQGDISDGNLNSFVQGGGLLANARQFPGIANMMIELMGLASPGDGGQGVFYWNPSSNAADDGGVTTIQPNGVLTGRWLRLPPSVPGTAPTATDCANVIAFGADPTGAADSTGAFVAAWLSSPAICAPAGTFKISSALVVPVNGSLSGAGPSTVILPVTTGQTCFNFSISPTGPANLSFRNFTISALAANVYGMYLTQSDYVSVENVTFAGCLLSVVADRGSYHSLVNCIAIGNNSFQPGGVQYFSSNETDHISYVTIQNFRLISNDSVGAVGPAGVSGIGIYLRRCVGGYISGCSGNNLSQGVAQNFIVLEDDCQGCKVHRSISVGAESGILIQPGAGSSTAPSFTEIMDFDADYIQFAGINVACSAPAPCNYLTVIGGELTFPQGASASFINCAWCNFLTILGVTMDNYNGFSTPAGTGVILAETNFISFSDCMLTNLAVAVETAGGVQNLLLESNLIFNCPVGLLGYSNLLNGSATAIRRNIGINPIEGVTPPAVPPSGVGQSNNQATDCLVCVNGGSAVQVYINGTNTGLATGAFLIEAGVGEITLVYSSAPTWAWVGL